MKQILFLLYLIIPFSINAQPTAQQSLVTLRSVDYNSTASFEQLKQRLKHNEIANLERALVNNDFVAFTHFLHRELDKKQVAPLFETTTQKLKGQHWQLVKHFNTIYIPSPGNAFSTYGNENTITLKAQVDSQTLYCNYKYTFQVIDSAILINSIDVSTSCNDKELDRFLVPPELKSYHQATFKLLLSQRSNYQTFSARMDSVVTLFRSLEKYHYDFIEPDKLNMKMSLSFGTLSYNLFWEKDFMGALQAAQKALALDSTANYVNSYVALAYLLLDDFEKAQQIYMDLKDKMMDKNTLYKTAFLVDIQSLIHFGIKHPHFEVVIKMLQQ